MGLATAHKLSREGFNICVVHRDRRSAAIAAEEEFEKMRKREEKCLSFNMDALNHESQEKLLDELKATIKEERISLLLHSVARGNLKLMAAYKEVLPKDDAYRPTAEYLQKEFGRETSFLKQEDFQLTMEAMAISFYTWVQAIFSRGLFASKACVLSLTSEGSTRAWRNYAAVGAAKAALESVSRSMAVEFAAYGIRSNILQPGVTITPSFRKIKGNELIEQQSLLRNPNGRLTTPEDVANVVYLMSRNEAEWINGAVIPVDGGESIA